MASAARIPGRAALSSVWNPALRVARALRVPRPVKLFFAQYLPHRPDGRSHLHGDRVLATAAETIIALLGIPAVVETGTYLGDSAYFFAGLPGVEVWTCEVHSRLYRVARNRLRDLSNVHVAHADSVDFLRRLLPALPGGTRFYWLDAHWYGRLPLADELALIAEDGKPGVIVIDDFHVPDEPQFGFDDYGAGRRIDLDYIRPYLRRMPSPLLLPRYGFAEAGVDPARLRGHAVLLQQLAEEDLARLLSAPPLATAYRLVTSDEGVARG